MIIQQVIGVIFLAIIFGIIGVPVMKWNAKELPWLTHLKVWGWAYLRSVVIGVVILDVLAFAMRPEVAKPLINLFGLGVSLALGTLITRDLKKLGAEKQGFPGIGARVILSYFAVSATIAVILGIAMMAGGMK